MFCVRVPLRLIAVCSTIAVLLSCAASAQTATHFTANNASASASLVTTDFLSSFSGQVWTNVSSDQGTQTFLVLDVMTQNDTSFTEIYGFGMIPNQDFQGDSTGHMALNVDVSQVAGFTSCTTDFTNNNAVTCTDTPAGTVNIVWQKPKFSALQASYSFTKNRFDFARMTLFLVGRSDNTNSAASGSAFGISFPAGYGEIGISSQVYITIQRNP